MPSTSTVKENMVKTETGIKWLSNASERSMICLEAENEGRLIVASFMWVETPNVGEEPVHILLGGLQTQIDVVSGLRYLVHRFGSRRYARLMYDPHWNKPVPFVEGLRALKAVVQEQLEERTRFFRLEDNKAAAAEQEIVLKRFEEHFEAIFKAHVENSELDAFDSDIWLAAFETI